MALNIEALRSSFETVKGAGPAVVDKFYSILFGDHPEAKPLFAKTDMAKQKKALLHSLVYIVDHLEEEKALYDYLFKMGRRHAEYGAEELHYDLVGASLLKTFAYFFKESWSEELEAQWAEAYGVVRAVMLEGMASVKTPDLRDRAREICNDLLLEVLESELDGQVLDAIRGKVREIIHSCMEEEAARLLKRAG